MWSFHFVSYICMFVLCLYICMYSVCPCGYCYIYCAWASIIAYHFTFRTRMERENQDLALEQIRLKAAEQRTTVLESIK